MPNEKKNNTTGQNLIKAALPVSLDSNESEELRQLALLHLAHVPTTEQVSLSLSLSLTHTLSPPSTPPSLCCLALSSSTVYTSRDVFCILQSLTHSLTPSLSLTPPPFPLPPLHQRSSAYLLNSLGVKEPKIATSSFKTTTRRNPHNQDSSPTLIDQQLRLLHRGAQACVLLLMCSLTLTNVFSYLDRSAASPPPPRGAGIF